MSPTASCYVWAVCSLSLDMLFWISFVPCKDKLLWGPTSNSEVSKFASPFVRSLLMTANYVCTVFCYAVSIHTITSRGVLSGWIMGLKYVERGPIIIIQINCKWVLTGGSITTIDHNTHKKNIKNKQPQWPESASELYRPSDHRLLARLVPTFEDRRVSRSQRGESPTAVISIF
jgi:hypothetical protein